MQLNAETQIIHYEKTSRLVCDIVTRIYKSIISKTPDISEPLIQREFIMFILRFDELYYKAFPVPNAATALYDYIANSRSVYNQNNICAIMGFLCGQIPEYINLLLCMSYKTYTDELIAQLNNPRMQRCSIEEARYIIGYGG